MNIFSRAMTIADRAQTKILSEMVQIVPRAGGRYAARQVDPARNVIEIRAVFTGAGEQHAHTGRREPSHFKGVARGMGMEAELWLSAEQVAALDWRPQSGDLVVLTGRVPVETYAISACEPNDLGDLTLVLTVEDQK